MFSLNAFLYLDCISILRQMISSMGLDFLNPTPQLKHTDVIGFCMQLENSISEREGVTLVYGREKRKGT